MSKYQKKVKIAKRTKRRHEVFSNFKKDLPMVDGKVFVITGTTSGTGFVAARTIAELGGEVVLLNRKSSRVATSMDKLKKAVPKGGKFVSIECDLQSFESVRLAVKEIKSKYPKIYCLANNAGIMCTPDEATVDGYDTQMQTNHLSHFLLTAELFPLLQAEAKDSGGGGACIVNHSSFGRLHTPNKGLEEKYFQKNGGNLGGNEIKMMGGACFHRYFQTKLANSVFTYALDEKLRASEMPIRVVCAHPGASNTNLDNHVDFGLFWRFMTPILQTFMVQSDEEGAMGLIKGMVDPTAESGVLYGPKNGGTKGLPVPNPKETYETDPAAFEMLWRTSEEATGVKFEI